MGSVSLESKRAYNSAGWGGWNACPAVAIDYCYHSDQVVVYRAQVQYRGDETLTSASVSTNFALYQYSQYDRDNHDTSITCYLYTSDPTGGSSTPPSGYIATASTGLINIGYWGKYLTFNFNVSTRAQYLYFWFVDNATYHDFSGRAYKDAVYSYKTGNEYTREPKADGRFDGYNPPVTTTHTIYFKDGSSTIATRTFKYGDVISVPTYGDKPSESGNATFRLTPDATQGEIIDPSQYGTCTRTGTITHPFRAWESREAGAGFIGGSSLTMYFSEDIYAYATWSTNYNNCTYVTNVSGISTPTKEDGYATYFTLHAYKNDGTDYHDDLTSQAIARFVFKEWTRENESYPWIYDPVTSSSRFNDNAAIFASWNVTQWLSAPSEIPIPAYSGHGIYLGLGATDRAIIPDAGFFAGEIYIPTAPGEVTKYAVWAPDGSVMVRTNGYLARYLTYIWSSTKSLWEYYLPYVWHNGRWVPCGGAPIRRPQFTLSDTSAGAYVYGERFNPLTNTFDWELVLLKNNSIKFTRLESSIDRFIVGGGGCGGKADYFSGYGSGGGGGGGGISSTFDYTPSLNVSYPIVIGAGGKVCTYGTHCQAGSSSAFGLTAYGGFAPYLLDNRGETPTPTPGRGLGGFGVFPWNYPSRRESSAGENGEYPFNGDLLTILTQYNKRYGAGGGGAGMYRRLGDDMDIDAAASPGGIDTGGAGGYKAPGHSPVANSGSGGGGGAFWIDNGTIHQELGAYGADGIIIIRNHKS